MRFIRTLSLAGIIFILFSCLPVRDDILITFTAKPTTQQQATPTLTLTPFPTLTNIPTITSTESAPVPLDTPTPKPVLNLCSPLAEQTIREISEIVSDPYNPPRPGKDDRHHGTDLAYYRRKDRTTIKGEVVQAVLAGRVVAVVADRLPYGNMVIVETSRDSLPTVINTQFGISEGEALYVLYAHFVDPSWVGLGDLVICGQALGEVGSTGYNIVNPHLHIETRIGPAGQFFLDGMAYYDTSASESERANYELWRTIGVFRHFDPMTFLSEYLENWAE